MTTNVRGLAVAGLAGLAIVQFTALSLSGGSPVVEPMGVGDEVPAIALPAAAGGGVDASASLVLVFDPHCAHTERIAAEWTSTLAGLDSDQGVVAVGLGDDVTVRRFATRHGWDVEVRSVQWEEGDAGERSLMRRSPWVFTVDGNGAVLSQNHGEQLADVAQLLIASQEAAQ